MLDALARALQASGHHVMLFATGDSTCPVPTGWVLEAAAGVGSGRSSTELRHTIGAYEWIGDQVDIVHDHTLVGPVYAQQFSSLPVVTTNHGPFQGELADYYRAVGDAVSIIAISEHQASTARHTRIAQVIPRGVDTDAIPVGDGSGGYALFLGRMCPDKGVHTTPSPGPSRSEW